MYATKFFDFNVGHFDEKLVAEHRCERCHSYTRHHAWQSLGATPGRLAPRLGGHATRPARSTRSFSSPQRASAAEGDRRARAVWLPACRPWPALLDDESTRCRDRQGQPGPGQARARSAGHRVGQKRGMDRLIDVSDLGYQYQLALPNWANEVPKSGTSPFGAGRLP